MIRRLSYITCHLCLIVLVSCTDLEENLVGEVTNDIQISGPPISVVDYLGTPYEELIGIRMVPLFGFIGIPTHRIIFTSIIPGLPSITLLIGPISRLAGSGIARNIARNTEPFGLTST